MREWSDEQLAARAADGCARSFEELARRWWPRVAVLVRRRAGGWADAEDVAQQTMVKAWGAMGRFERGRAFGPWVCRIAWRCAADHARARRRRPTEGLTSEPAAATRGDALESAERSADLWAIAERVLGERTAAALWLRYGEGMEPREIAEALGLATVQTRVMLHRARAKLAPHVRHLDERADGGVVVGPLEISGARP